MGNGDSAKRAYNAAWEFFHQKQSFEKRKKLFEERKNAFYDAMDSFFTEVGGKSAKLGDPSIDGKLFTVKRIENTSIVWDAEKLEKRVDRVIARKIINKRYHVQDMPGLICYLKSCGVDPKIFKQFIQVEKTVDEKAVDSLGDIGVLEVRQIAGCYTVKTQRPYYTVAVKEDG